MKKEEAMLWPRLEFNQIVKKLNITKGCFDGSRVNPSNITEGNIAL